MRRVHSWGFFATVCLTCCLGCHLIFGFDHPPEDSGGHGGATTQGGGGTTLTTSTQGGAGAATTTTIAGGSGGTTTTDPCTNNTQDGTETDVDCGGMECPQCAQGQKCLASSDCETPACVDGVCCDGLCKGVCYACSAAKKGQGEDGICEPQELGPDPDGACPAARICDGAGACISQPCVGPADCASGFCVDGYCCNGECAGMCFSCAVPSKEGTCTPTPAGNDYDGECNNAAPDDNCSGAGACGLGPLGGTCLSGMAASCESGNCADGFCCESPCTGQTCLACRKDYTGLPDGKCAAVKIGTDPENECPEDKYCVANDACGP